QIDVQIHDSSGASVNELFGIGSPRLIGLTAVDGSGRVVGNTTGTAIWTLIPSLGAAGADPKKYTVGGTLHYLDNGVPVTVTLAEVPITVYPQPELYLK